MLRVMSFNVRVMTSADGPNQWMYRRDAIAEMIATKEVDLLGLQEATRPQIDDLLERLGGYEWNGVGRLGGERAEFCPLFHRTDRLELTDQGNFWLSDRPEEPGSMGWDAAYVRVATWARLRRRDNARELFALNTHLDNKGDIARLEGARLVRRRVEALAGTTPAIVMGDFNCGSDSPAYLAMCADDGALHDARLASGEGHAGPVETFTGFRGSPHPPRLIDYIFVSPELTVRRTETLPDDWNGRQLSDHRALLAELE